MNYYIPNGELKNWLTTQIAKEMLG